MNHNFQILQIPFDDPRGRGRRFFSLEESDGLDLNLYKEVYSGSIEAADPMTALDDLFYTFNMEHPSDFTARSLSVSDIVVLDGKKFYCQPAGWQKIELGIGGNP